MTAPGALLVAEAQRLTRVVTEIELRMAVAQIALIAALEDREEAFEGILDAPQ